MVYIGQQPSDLPLELRDGVADTIGTCNRQLGLPFQGRRGDGQFDEGQIVNSTIPQQAEKPLELLVGEDLTFIQVLARLFEIRLRQSVCDLQRHRHANGCNPNAFPAVMETEDDPFRPVPVLHAGRSHDHFRTLRTTDEDRASFRIHVDVLQFAAPAIGPFGVVLAEHVLDECSGQEFRQRLVGTADVLVQHHSREAALVHLVQVEHGAKGHRVATVQRV